MNELTTTQEQAPAFSVGAALMNTATMQSLMTFAEMMSTSVVTVPEHLRNKPADCLAITMQAMRWGMDPFAVAQKTHIVSGRLGYEAQLVNAAVQTSGAIVGAFKYEYTGAGQDLKCRVGAVLRGETEITWGEWLRNGDVTVRNSPLWKVNPAQQLGYLQVKNWSRLYCPGSILGVYTADELEDIPAPPKNMGLADEVTPTAGPRRRSEPTTAPTTVDNETGEITPGTAEAAPSTQPENKPTPPVATSSTGSLSGGQVAYLRNKLKAAGISEESICDRFQVVGIELMDVSSFDTLKSELLGLV